jgi:glucose-1-phosphate thymidylyltransferase
MKKKFTRKGIILAGGEATRLKPITTIISKQLLPVYDKPMIYYPLSTLMMAGIRDILIITKPNDVENFRNLLGDGSQLGVKLSYLVQKKPNGIAETFIIASEFLDDHPCVLILGDNLFYGNHLQEILIKTSKNVNGATVFGYRVNNPNEFGVIEFDKKNKILSIEEKPKHPKSNYILTGLYFFDNTVTRYVKKLKPSKRGELEITDLNKIYLKKKQLKLVKLNRGFSWLDTGTPKSLIEANIFIELIEKRQGLKIGCIEEIAFQKKWINKKILIQSINKFKNSEYSEYLKYLLN